MHASARLRNLTATIWAYLDGLTITGEPRLISEGQRRSASMASPYALVIIEMGDGAYNGRASASMVSWRHPVTVTVQLFARSTEAAASGNLLDIDAMSADVADAFRQRELAVSDYVSNPTTPPAIAGAVVRFLGSPAPRRLPVSGSWVRRQVAAEATYTLQHAA